MKVMKKSFKKANKSDDLVSMKIQVDQFEKITSKAKKSKYKKNAKKRLAYEKGLKALKKQVSTLQVAIKAEDEIKARLILSKMKKICKHSHKALGVK